MSSSLAERLQSDIADLLDKRELELFQSAIAASRLPFHVLHVLVL